MGHERGNARARLVANLSAISGSRYSVIRPGEMPRRRAPSGRDRHDVAPMSFVRHRRPALLAVLAVSAAALLGAGCGDDDGGSANTDTATTETQATQPTTTQTPEEPAGAKGTEGEADGG